jgi:hypothetical protein
VNFITKPIESRKEEDLSSSGIDEQHVQFSERDIDEDSYSEAPET